MTPQLEVSFCIDQSGILTVRARDTDTGVVQGIRIEDPLGLEPNPETAETTENAENPESD